MDQDSNQPSDAKEAYEAYQAYKAYKAQKQSPGKLEPTPYTGRAPWDDSQIPGPANSAEAKEQLANLPSQLAQTALMAAPSPVNPWMRAGVQGSGSALAEYLKPGATGGDALKAGLLSGGISLAGSGLASLARSGANSAMKRAVGITGAKSKTAPQDIGNRLVDEGIWGTKAGMADQVAGKYGQAEKEVQDLAANVPGQVSGDKLAEAVESRAGRHLMPSTGQPIVGHGPDVDAMASRAAELRGLPQGAEGPVKGYGAQDLLALKRGGDWEGFTNSGTPATSTAAEIGRTQADAARAGLSDISSGAMPAALKREQALLLADKALSTPEMTYKNPISLTDIFSGGVGTALGGAPGTAIGIAASKAARTPLAQSIFAQGAQKVAAPAADAVSKLSPQEAALLKSLFTPNESQR
jgi:hypothetical protein